MGRLLFATAATGVLGAGMLAVSSARADDDGARFEGAVRVGYDVPVGSVDGLAGDNLDQTMSGGVPVGIELGIRAMPSTFFGAYGTFAPGSNGYALNATCDYNRWHGCSTDDGRVGFEAQFHLWPKLRWDPWVGGGVGYEWLRVHTGSETLSASGFEVNLQAGADVRLLPGFAAGPFVAMSLGEYTSQACDSCQAGTYFDTSRALHGWFTLGVRVVFDAALHTTPPPPPELKLD